MTLISEDGTGKADANSYATIVQADAYHDARLHAEAWTAATDTTKEAALAMATSTLDAMTRWKGSRATATQALAWPREGAIFDGLLIGDDEVPGPVVKATSELARLLIAEDLTADVSQNDLQGLNLGKGALEITFKSNKEKKRIPSIVEDLLQGLGRIAGGGNSIQLRNISR